MVDAGEPNHRVAQRDELEAEPETVCSQAEPHREDRHLEWCAATTSGAGSNPVRSAIFFKFNSLGLYFGRPSTRAPPIRPDWCGLTASIGEQADQGVIHLL